jgi:hypothetical protein
MIFIDNLLIKKILCINEFFATYFITIRYELAILRNKMKGTPVVPVYVGSADQNSTKSEFLDFTPFDLSNLDSTKFPNSAHVRGKDLQFFIEETR